ncbi:MAG: cytochrome c-type biogenesis protein CcmH [Armatimonadetes bacterium]|nr:cytochrome c-type biogenesis protein CcmH [Anaerolineae bacterium]
MMTKCAASLVIAWLLVCAAPLLAQPVPLPLPDNVTYDDVNAVAGAMYCPECENIPLDKCYSAVCTQWKNEIAQQLAQGRTPDAVIDGFVARFGDQVLGIPQNQTLRDIALLTPYILAAVALLFGGVAVLRWRMTGPDAASADTAPFPIPSDAYRQRLEDDLG